MYTEGRGTRHETRHVDAPAVIVWLMTVGEPIPLPGAAERLLRTGVLSGHLARAGHRVVWWNSRVDHFRKRFHPVEGAALDIDDHQTLRLLSGRLYRRNVSLSRFLNHREIAADFRRRCVAASRPDLILCSLPTVELSLEAVRYGARANVPVILDLRDPWPDVYYRALPQPLRRLGPWLFAPLVREARTALRGATGLIAVSESYLRWGLRLAGRDRSHADAVITHGYPTPPTVSDDELRAWRRTLQLDDTNLMVWFVGSFAWHYDLGTVIEAARLLADRRDLVFVLTGAGDREAEWRRRAEGLSNVRFTGWVDRPALAALSRLAAAGLVSYTPDAPNSLTNKLFEYMSAGLPILLGLRGDAEAIVREWNAGLAYRPGDPADLARVICRLADDEALREGLAEGSARAFRSSFSEEIIYPRFVSHLEAVARLGRGDSLAV